MPASAGLTSSTPSSSCRGRLHQRGLLLGVAHAHAADVAGERALGDELREHRLGHRGRMAVDEAPRRGEGVDQGRRHHDVAETKAGKSTLLKVPT